MYGTEENDTGPYTIAEQISVYTTLFCHIQFKGRASECIYE